MSAVLVYSERQSLTLELLSGARDLASQQGVSLAVALLTPESAGWADACFQHGAERAYLAKHDALVDYQADTYAAALAQLAAQAEAEWVLVGSTRRGRTLAPRVAQKLGAGCVTDASQLAVQDGGLVSKRLAFGGNTMKEESVTSAVSVIAVVPGTFEAETSGGSGDLVEVALDLTPSRAQTVERRAKGVGAVNVEEAPRLVSMGRGVQEKDDIALIESLAQALDAEVVGTRPLAYELEWISEDRMIGISGKSVSPRLYVAVGISGQIQHTVSIRGSKLIFAINKDKSAPIFEMADYGIVGDLYEIIPRLIEALQQSA